MRIENLSHSGDENEETPLSGDDAAGDLNAALGAGQDAEFYVAEERKPAARSWMVLATLVALGGAGLYFMHLRAGPGKANAAAVAESQMASKTIASFLEGGDSNIKLMEKMLNDTQRVVERFITYPNANQVPLADLATNPFRLAFQQDPSATSELILRKRREAERQAVINAVQTLQLQSVMSGSQNRSCMINNTLYREGQVVEGFTIEQISSKSVIVKQGPYRFELRMQR